MSALHRETNANERDDVDESPDDFLKEAHLNGETYFSQRNQQQEMLSNMKTLWDKTVAENQRSPDKVCLSADGQ